MLFALKVQIPILDIILLNIDLEANIDMNGVVLKNRLTSFPLFINIWSIFAGQAALSASRSR